MIRSDSLGELAKALSDAQGEFEAVDKTAANPFFKSKYADLPTVVKAATPILTKHGLSVSQLPGHDELGDTLTTVLLHSSGQFIGNTMALRPVKDNDPQAQGSAMTYGRRYAYMAILGLVADEDDDGNAASRASTSRPARQQQAKPAAKKAEPAKPKTEPAKAPASSLEAPVIDRLREIRQRSGWSKDKLQLELVHVGVADAEDVAAAIQSLNLEQAILLAEAMGGTAAELLGTEE